MEETTEVVSKAGKWTSYKRAYKTKWEKESAFAGWLTENLDEEKALAGKHAYCTVCKKGLRAHHSDLKKHSATPSHKRNSLIIRSIVKNEPQKPIAALVQVRTDIMSTPIAYLTRRETFSACHRLHSAALSDADNLETYGKCNNFYGHGHNYTVEVTVRGPVIPATGMVMNINDLKQHMKDVVMDVMDHKNIDKDVSYFKNVPSTSENIAIYIWKQLIQIDQLANILFEVKIIETDKNIVSYKGE